MEREVWDRSIEGAASGGSSTTGTANPSEKAAGPKMFQMPSGSSGSAREKSQGAPSGVQKSSESGLKSWQRIISTTTELTAERPASQQNGESPSTWLPSSEARGQ